MIYCVVPEPLADELYDKLANYYEDDPNVTVIVDRRKQERREAGGGGAPTAPGARKHRGSVPVRGTHAPDGTAGPLALYRPPRRPVRPRTLPAQAAVGATAWRLPPSRFRDQPRTGPSPSLP